MPTQSSASVAATQNVEIALSQDHLASDGQAVANVLAPAAGMQVTAGSGSGPTLNPRQRRKVKTRKRLAANRAKAKNIADDNVLLDGEAPVGDDADENAGNREESDARDDANDATDEETPKSPDGNAAGDATEIDQLQDGVPRSVMQHAAEMVSYFFNTYVIGPLTRLLRAGGTRN